jgi:hypothetical protein
MSTYLLLRDNKECGPYSFDELKNKGLKAYDLVWIEGRSAAWRYPSEVEELRSFAPAVEEQPFDRFFKRPSQSNSSLASQNNSSVTANAQTRPVPEKEPSFSAGINGPVITAEPSSVPGKRIIYVTLPSDKNSGGLQAPTYREPARMQPSIPVPETRTRTGEIEPARTELSSLCVKAAGPVEEKFSRENGDMWKRSVELSPRQQRPGLKKIIQPVMAVACVLALLAAGIFIGLSIKSDTFGFSQKNDTKENLPPRVSSPIQQDHVLTESTPVTAPPVTTPAPVSNTPPNTNTDNAANPTANNTSSVAAGPVSAAVEQKVAISTPDQTPIALPPAPKKKMTRAKSSSVNSKLSSLSPAGKDSAAMNLSVVNRESTHRNDEPSPGKDAIRSNIANMLTVGAGKYSVGTFGGISDVQLTVSNHSMYPMDLVVVEVQYVQSNKKIYKTENLYFRGLGPGSAMMQEAPKSSRGVKIQYKITLVNSKELGLSFSGI